MVWGLDWVRARIRVRVRVRVRVCVETAVHVFRTLSPSTEMAIFQQILMGEG